MNLTRAVSDVVSDIAKNPALNSGVLAMMERADEFADPLTPKLAGVYINPDARAVFDERLDELWARTSLPSAVPEIIVGGGLHAAIYAAVRVREGAPKPLVIEAKERVGGAFAVSSRPTFYLNSTNRPGDIGTPGRGEALNYLPGAIVQPSDLSGEEYQTNAAVAFTIRATLAAATKVIAGQKVARVDGSGVILESGRRIDAARVIYATGLGEPKGPPEMDGGHFKSYMQFLASLDQPFPMRGVKRVAVIGAGDSGKTVIEALTGQGPVMPYSVSALDWPESIDWYGVPETCVTRELWERGNRSRYKGLGRVLPKNGSTPNRVRPISRRAANVGVGYNGAYVDGARYDLVVWCGGFEAEQQPGVPFKVGGREVALMMQSDALNTLVVGPAANLELGFDANINPNGNDIPENSAAVFRYADRTAALAMSLPKLELSSTGETPSPGLGDKVVQIQPIQFATTTSETNPPFASEVVDKTDPKNWEPGDRLTYMLSDRAGATVSKVEGGDVYITDEIEGNGSNSLPNGRERLLSSVGPGTPWTYKGPGDPPPKPVKRNPRDWAVGDRIRRTSDGLMATVIGVRPLQVKRDNGSPGRSITPEYWEYASSTLIEPELDKSDPANWRPGDRVRRTDDGVTATVVSQTNGRVQITDERTAGGVVQLPQGQTRGISASVWEYIGTSSQPASPDKSDPRSWAKDDTIQRVSDGVTATIRRVGTRLNGKPEIEIGNDSSYPNYGSGPRVIQPGSWRFVR